jgi:hypothetical protein
MMRKVFLSFFLLLVAVAVNAQRLTVGTKD